MSNAAWKKVSVRRKRYQSFTFLIPYHGLSLLKPQIKWDLFSERTAKEVTFERENYRISSTAWKVKVINHPIILKMA